MATEPWGSHLTTLQRMYGIGFLIIVLALLTVSLWANPVSEVEVPITSILANTATSTATSTGH